MTTDKITTLGDFAKCVRKIRTNLWRVTENKELWFRGESKDHQDTLLRPELYRPRKDHHALKAIDDLLDQQCIRKRVAIPIDYAK
jgi:hypothetical protein